LQDETDEDKGELISDKDDNNDNEDEFDPSVEASDQAMVDDVAVEVENGELPPLTRVEVNLGWFAITKVCSHILLIY